MHLYIRIEFMAKTRQQKETAFNQLSEQFDEAKSVVVAEFTATPITALESLRSNMRDENVKMSVVKKTLLAKLLVDKKVEEIDVSDITGNLMIAFSEGDEVGAAKTVHAFTKEQENVTILGGVLESKTLEATEVNALALLPSREELLAKTVATINAPVSGFVNVLAGNIRGLVTALHAIGETKQ